MSFDLVEIANREHEAVGGGEPPVPGALRPVRGHSSTPLGITRTAPGGRRRSRLSTFPTSDDGDHTAAESHGGPHGQPAVAPAGVVAAAVVDDVGQPRAAGSHVRYAHGEFVAVHQVDLVAVEHSSQFAKTAQRCAPLQVDPLDRHVRAGQLVRDPALALGRDHDHARATDADESSGELSPPSALPRRARRFLSSAQSDGR